MKQIEIELFDEEVKSLLKGNMVKIFTGSDMGIEVSIKIPAHLVKDKNVTINRR